MEAASNYWTTLVLLHLDKIGHYQLNTNKCPNSNIISQHFRCLFRWISYRKQLFLIRPKNHYRLIDKSRLFIIFKQKKKPNSLWFQLDPVRICSFYLFYYKSSGFWLVDWQNKTFIRWEMWTFFSVFWHFTDQTINCLIEKMISRLICNDNNLSSSSTISRFSLLLPLAEFSFSFFINIETVLCNKSLMLDHWSLTLTAWYWNVRVA